MTTKITAASKRTIYHVMPRGDGWGCKVSGQWIVVSNVAQLIDKKSYVAAVKALARKNWKERGCLGEVIVHNRKSKGRMKIGKGKGSRTTYGRDPEKSKG